jgi:hypothetical protein
MLSTDLLLTTHLAATLFMTGLIWFVQVVHYPLLLRVGAEAFTAYERQHTRRTGWVVGPAMLVELATGIALLFVLGSDGNGPAVAWWANIAGLLALWGSTAAVQMPLHRRLEQRFARRDIERLVRTNWWRTALWSGRSALLVGIVVAA